MHENPPTVTHNDADNGISPAAAPSIERAAEIGSDTSDSSATSWKHTATLFLAGQAISMFGSAMVQFAVMWYLTLETGSPTIVTLYAIFAFAPQGILSLFGGTLADRVNRKLLIIVPDAIIALATLILALIMASGRHDLWIILLVVAIRSIGAGFQSPAVSALLPSLVPEQHLLRMNGIYSTIQSVIGIAAPAAGGIVYAAGGIGPTLYVDVITAIIGIGILLFIPVAAQPPTREQSPFHHELVAGIRYTARHSFIRWLLTVYAVVFVLIVAPSFLVPLMVTQRFGNHVWQLTAVEIAFHVGMIAGGIAISTVLAKRSRMHMLFGSSMIFGILAIAMAISPSFWGIFTLMALVGVFVPVFSGPSMTALQETTDPEYMGRVMSQVSIVFTLGMPIGMAIFGPLSELFGVSQVIAATGGVTIIFVLIAFYATRTGRSALKNSK